MAVTAGLPAADGSHAGERVDWRQVRTILWAKYRIFLRNATASWWKAVLAGLAILFQAAFVIAGVATAAGVTYYLRTEHPEDARAAIAVGYFLVFVSLAITPALGLRANEFLDVTKLFLLPVSHRTVFAATLFGLSTSPMALMLTLSLASASAVYAGTLAAVVPAALCAFATAACGIAAGHLVLLTFLDVFRSRRWRDLSTVILAIAGAGIVTAIRLAGSGSGHTNLLAPLRSLASVADTLVFLPSWWGAHAVTATTVASILPALALPLLLWWIVRVAARVQERVWMGDIEEAHDEAGVRRGLPARVGGLFRGALGAVVEKDLAVLSREPGVRIQFVQSLAYSVVPLVLGVMQSSRREDARDAAQWLGFAGYFLVVFGCAGLLFNPLGTEGAGIAHALQTPVRRATLLAGKGIAHVLLLGPVCGLIAAAAAVIGGVFADWDAARMAGAAGIAFAEAVCAAACVAGAGLVVGVWFPVPTAFRDRRAITQSQQRKGAGCVRPILAVAGFAGALALMVPLVLLFRHPWLVRAAGSDLDTRVWLVLTIPLAFVWAAVVLWAGSAAGGSLLAAREETVAGEMTRQQA